MTKRLFDIVVSLSGLIVLTPLLLLIATWIRVDSPGPIFFQQERVGYLGNPFKIYKFRTMVTDAESQGGQLTIGGDRRITRSGQLLRRYKLDELPQLLNVLKGEMSLVGPRPEVPKYVALYTPEQRQVLNVRPGITDLASMEFRNENDLLAKTTNPEAFYVAEIMPRKLALNQQYIQQANLRHDLKIILKTLKLLVHTSQRSLA